MSPPDRKEAEVRRLLDRGHAPLPPDLGLRARARGESVLRRRYGMRAVLWTLAAFAVLAFALWAAFAQPWPVPPAETTPPVRTW